MGTIRIGYKKKRIKVRGKFGEACIYKKRELEEFNPKVLGLGDIGAKSEQIGVIAAFFDLSGFTSFCSQVDPHLSMPKFLNEFVKWLFEQIKRELQVKEVSDGIACYSEVPFFAKFMGDGVLFLWNTKGMDDVMICNIATTVWEVCDNYYSVFIPRLKGHWSYYPNSVRCGVACGNVCSVGNGEDYVGPCINIASRLLKLSSIPFCISRRGVEFEVGMRSRTKKLLMVKQVDIRGIGEEELVIVAKSDFEELPSEEQEIFKEVSV